MQPSPSQEHLERWVATWREAGPALEAQRRAELEGLTTPQALAELADAFAHARQRGPHPITSGLVEQQRYFRRIAR
jgi:hypothetical protein